MRPPRLTARALSWCLLAALASCAAPGADEPGLAEHELVVCGRGPTVEGIDVSYYQGTIDWAAVAGDGIRYAIVRIGDGTYRDPQFARNWSEARAHGLLRGSYQFFRPNVDPLVQADIVVEAVGRLGPGDLPVTIDVEAPSPSVSPAEYTRRIHQWVDRVTEGTGRAPIVYTGRYYWDPYVASSDFTSLPLWHAQYTSASCPNINDRWSDWAFWQYTSSGRVAGISGNVDRNRWNGTYEELAAFAASNRAPAGWLDAATCEGIRGWAQDPDAADAPIDVHVYVGGPAGDPSAIGFPLRADARREDLCAAIGSCDHGFSMRMPLSFFDGIEREVYAYGIDATGGENALLSGAPQTVRCDEPPFPMPSAGVVRRHVPSAEVLAAWGLDFVDVAPLDDAMLDAVPDGPDLTDAPELVQVEGEPAVYVREHGVLRHVTSPDAMSAWGFAWERVRVVAPGELDGDLEGAAWLDVPFLARGSGPAVYLIDAPPPLWAERTSGDLPARIAAGAASDATLRFRNRGSATWGAGEVVLAPTPRDPATGEATASELCDPSWPSCDHAAAFEHEVLPGEEASVRVRLRAPMEEGPVTVCFGLALVREAQGTHGFSDPGQNGPADDALCGTIEVVAATATTPGDDGGVPRRGGEAVSGGCSCRAAGGASRGGIDGALSSALALALVAARSGRGRRSAARRRAI